jgi:hypothetical protein
VAKFAWPASLFIVQHRGLFSPTCTGDECRCRPSILEGTEASEVPHSIVLAVVAAKHLMQTVKDQPARTCPIHPGHSAPPQYDEQPRTTTIAVAGWSGSVLCRYMQDACVLPPNSRCSAPVIGCFILDHYIPPDHSRRQTTMHYPFCEEEP